jgi:hypothetical protein
MVRPQRAAHEPPYDLHPRTGATIEVFTARWSFGRVGAGWFWCCRRRGFSPTAAPIGLCHDVSARDVGGRADLVVMNSGVRRQQVEVGCFPHASPK